MNIIVFTTLLLATWRISHLLAYENGPLEIISTFRYWLGVRYYPEPPYAAYGKNVFSQAVLCVWCNSIWVGLTCTILYGLYNPLWLIALPFALSAGAIALEKILGEKETDGAS